MNYFVEPVSSTKHFVERIYHYIIHKYVDSCATMKEIISVEQFDLRYTIVAWQH